LRVYSWNSADQDDLYQEILFQIWRSLPALKEKHFRQHRLYRVAINTAISFVRKRASGSDRVIHFENADLTRMIESRQTPEALTTELRIFTPNLQTDPLEKALVTLFLRTSTYEQIAEATGIRAIMSASCCIAQRRNFPV